MAQVDTCARGRDKGTSGCLRQLRSEIARAAARAHPIDTGIGETGLEK